MTRSNWFHPGVFLPVVILLSFSMVRTSDGQRQNVTVLKFNDAFRIAFSPVKLKRLLECLCKAETYKCDYYYELDTNSKYYIPKNEVASEDKILASEEDGSTFRCNPGGFTSTKSFISCVRSSDSSDHCVNEHYCQPYFVNLDYEGCDSECINIWWEAHRVQHKNDAGYPEFIAGDCELSKGSLSAGHSDSNNDTRNNNGNNDASTNDAGNNEGNNDAGNNDADNNDSNNDGNNDAGNEDAHNNDENKDAINNDGDNDRVNNDDNKDTGNNGRKNDAGNNDAHNDDDNKEAGNNDSDDDANDKDVNNDAANNDAENNGGNTDAGNNDAHNNDDNKDAGNNDGNNDGDNNGGKIDTDNNDDNEDAGNNGGENDTGNNDDNEDAGNNRGENDAGNNDRNNDAGNNDNDNDANNKDAGNNDTAHNDERNNGGNDGADNYDGNNGTGNNDIHNNDDNKDAGNNDEGQNDERNNDSDNDAGEFHGNNNAGNNDGNNDASNKNDNTDAGNNYASNNDAGNNDDNKDAGNYDGNNDGGKNDAHNNNDKKDAGDYDGKNNAGNNDDNNDAGNNDGKNNAGNNDGKNNAGNNDDNNDAGNNDASKNGAGNYDAHYNDNNNDAGDNDENNDASKNNSNNDAHNSDEADTTSLMVAAAGGWLLFGLLAGSVFIFLFCWKCRKAFVIHRRNQSELKNSKFVASRNGPLPNTYGKDQSSSKHGRGNENKNNGHSNGYTDYNEINYVYNVIDDEQISGVKKRNAKTNGARPGNKKVLPHSPHFTLESDENEGNSQTAINGHLPTMISGGNVSQRNKLSTEAADAKMNGIKPVNKKVLPQSLYFILEPDEVSEGNSQAVKLSTETTDAYSRLQTGRSAADPQMTKSAMLIYNRPLDTLSINDQGGIDPERPGHAEDSVTRSVDPYNLASAVYDERDESASRH
ncbi:hypothetical protein PoB_003437300 [Plakobranchus ocellatus]|uniref:Uncharacterized protein n=1 Tax=Plakobranchus ocellatus TaxID=259542 RepID=A0AAV4AKP0_9GAST|nr:hypothetical protein PoB_003437300 [Plakobranchus ocellatus]